MLGRVLMLPECGSVIGLNHCWYLCGLPWESVYSGCWALWSWALCEMYTPSLLNKQQPIWNYGPTWVYSIPSMSTWDYLFRQFASFPSKGNRTTPVPWPLHPMHVSPPWIRLVHHPLTTFTPTTFSLTQVSYSPPLFTPTIPSPHPP